MKANLKKLRKRRVFTDEFKQSLVKEFDTGQYSQYSVIELSRTTISSKIYYPNLIKGIGICGGKGVTSPDPVSC